MIPVTFRVVEETALLRHGSAVIAKRLPKQKNTGDLAASRGSLAGYVAHWPATDITGLWADLAHRMKHLGGNSTPISFE